MVDLVDDRKALTHVLEEVLVLDEDSPIVLALEKAGVQRASDFVSLQLTPDTPLKYDRPAEGSDKVKKNVPLLVAETRQLMGLQEYIRYHAKNVSHKVYESIDFAVLSLSSLSSFQMDKCCRIVIRTSIPVDYLSE